MGALDVVLAAGLTAAQIAAQLAPVPYCSPAVAALVGLVQLCDQVQCNKFSVRQLSSRSCVLMLTFKEQGEKMPSNRLQDATDSVKMTLLAVQEKMSQWVEAGWAKSLMANKDIKRDIESCHQSIDDCLATFQVISQAEIHKWQSEFQKNAERDHNEELRYLSDISNTQNIMLGVVNQHSGVLQQVMAMMQNGLAEKQLDDRALNGLQVNLHQLQRRNDVLLPDRNLKRGEVRRIGNFPVNGTSSMDIWEGLYLTDEKVAIKVLRAVNSDANSLRRFEREVNIWGDIWEKDRGKHILPFYGFCTNDGPYPYMVSPWMHNGTAIAYVKANSDSVNYLDFIRYIADGIAVLHCYNPPIVHGDLKGSNIVVNGFGQPLIADFGVSRIVEDITGVPFTQSHGVSDSYRWFAPELCIDQGVLSTYADIYAFSMTILELITHQQPFHSIKHTTEAVIRASEGKRPKRPTERHVIARGLDDKLWNLLCRCWSADPTSRPTICQIIDEISES